MLKRPNAAQRLQPHLRSPCPPCFSSLNTEGTEALRDLCVKSFPAAEATEKNLRAARGSCKTALPRNLAIILGVRFFIVSTVLLHPDGNPH
jgi:hypothetical protein